MKSLKPCLIILSGMPLTGKNYLANKLQRLFFPLIWRDVDRIRKLYESYNPKNEQSISSDYEKQIMIKSYEILCRTDIKFYLKETIPVLISGTFSKKEFKKPLRKLVKKIQKLNIPIKCFQLNCSEKEIKKRIKKRIKEGSLSNIDTIEKFNWAKSIFEPIDFLPIIEIDTTDKNYFKDILKEFEDLKC